MSGLRRRAEAKVNLALAVTGVLPDGYHALRSVVLRLDLADDLAATGLPAEPGVDRLAIVGAPDLATEGNLVLLACERLRAIAGRPLPALDLSLVKRIPVGAGLGGGSSDAAAAVDLAAAAWGLDLDPGERLAIATRLGADVPFFAAGHRAALVGGIGEAVEPLRLAAGDLGLCLVVPTVRLSTGAVFGAWDAGARPARRDTVADVEALAALLASGAGGADLAAAAHRWRDANDLWPAAIAVQPSLAALRDRVESASGRPVHMSGSGSTLFALYPSGEAARQAAAALAASLPTESGDPGLRVIAATPSRREEP